MLLLQASARLAACEEQAAADLCMSPRPRLPSRLDACLQGGWNLTQDIYDYAAALPMSVVHSWEEPRLVRQR